MNEANNQISPARAGSGGGSSAVISRRAFVVRASVVGAVLADSTVMAADLAAQSTEENKPMDNKNIIVAADPFAMTLKDAISEHLKGKGYAVTDMGAVKGKETPYFDSAQEVCKALQAGKAAHAILFCGTGMGMAIVANRFKGVTAAVVESVFAAKMARVINNANVLCLGQMIWGEWMAKEAVDVFLNTKFTQGLEPLAGFLQDACKKVDAIRP